MSVAAGANGLPYCCMVHFQEIVMAKADASDSGWLAI